MALFGSSGGDVSARLARIEQKLDLLIAGLGLAGGGQDPRLAEVRALAAGGRKIEAIKLYREITGQGLREAKEAVDAM